MLSAQCPVHCTEYRAYIDLLSRMHPLTQCQQSNPVTLSSHTVQGSPVCLSAIDSLSLSLSRSLFLSLLYCFSVYFAQLGRRCAAAPAVHVFASFFPFLSSFHNSFLLLFLCSRPEPLETYLCPSWLGFSLESLSPCPGSVFVVLLFVLVRGFSSLFWPLFSLLAHLFFEPCLILYISSFSSRFDFISIFFIFASFASLVACK